MGVNRKLGNSGGNWLFRWDCFSRWDLYPSANYVIFIMAYWYRGPHFGTKKGKYTFLYTDIFFFRLFLQFKTKENLFSNKKICT